MSLDEETGEDLSPPPTDDVQKPALRSPPLPVTLSPTDVPEGAQGATQCACPPKEQESEQGQHDSGIQGGFMKS